MKKITLLLSAFAAIFTVSCVETTARVSEVFAEYEKNIEYHDKAFMKSKKMEVPHNVDEKNFRNLKFIFAFEQDNTKVNGGIERTKYSLNYLTPVEWRTFKREFEQAMERTKRFDTGQMQEILADNESRKNNRDGFINLQDLDQTQMSLSEGIINVRPTLETSESNATLNFFQGGGRLNTTLTTMKITCVPTLAKNNEIAKGFASFAVQTDGEIKRRYNREGKLKDSLVFDEHSYEALHQSHGAATLIRTICQIYSAFPVGGSILNFDPDDGDGVAIINASTEEGVQPEMQFVIYAMKKSDGDAAIRVPLYNATLVSLGRTGNSTLRVWRKNTSSKTAKEIIKKVSTNFKAAQNEYNFYGCSDGLAEWPAAIMDRPFAHEE